MSLPIEFYHQKAKIIFRKWDDLFEYSKAKITAKDSFDAWMRKPSSIIIRQAQDDLKLIKYIFQNQKNLPLGYEPSFGTKFLNLTKSDDEIKYYKFLLIKNKITQPDYLLLRKGEDVIPFCFQNLNNLISFLEDLGDKNLVGKHSFVYIAVEENYRFESDGRTIRILKSLSLSDGKKYYSKTGNLPDKKATTTAKKTKATPKKKETVRKPKGKPTAPRKSKVIFQDSSDTDSEEEEETFRTPSRRPSQSSRGRGRGREKEKNYNDLRAKYGIYGI